MLSTDAPCDPWVTAGIPTFPCYPDQKKPAAKWRPKIDGALTRPLDLEEARQLWDSFKGRSKALIPGLDCEATGMVVIDLDRNKPANPDVDGIMEFSALCSRHQITLDKPVSVMTPSGGRHLFFADPTGRWCNTTSELAPGVDTRGVGGFVIAPGSKRANGVYQPINPSNLGDLIKILAERRLQPPPPALAALLDTKCASSKAAALPLIRQQSAVYTLGVVPMPQAGHLHLSTATEELGAGIARPWSPSLAIATLQAAKPGSRNDTMSRVAYTAGLRAQALGLDEIETIETFLQTANRAGWDEAAKTRDTAERQFRAGRDAAARQMMVGKPITQVGSTPPAAVSSVAIGLGGKNMLRSIELMLQRNGVSARRDRFRDKVVLTSKAPGQLPVEHTGPITDNACRWLAKNLRDIYGVSLTYSNVSEVLCDLAEHSPFNPVVDWIKQLTWDGVSRLDDWLPKVTGADPTELTKAAGVLLIQGMVMRARWPGTKFDLCFVLEGPQGIGKSSLALALCDGPGTGLFCDAPGFLAMDGKARSELLRGKWVIELAELAGLRKSGAEEIKAFLSLTADQYRPAYAHHAVEQPRTAIFVATTNVGQYLQDSSGNRRFVPVACQKVDINWFRTNRDQLFAEAAARVDAIATGVPEGVPLPAPVAEKFSLPRQHWTALAEITEDRREISTLEVFLPEVLKDLAAKPDGIDAKKGHYVQAKRLLEMLEVRLPGKVSTSGLGSLMGKFGWHAGRCGKDRVRVYFPPGHGP